MVETPQDELSLRDIVEVLRRHRVYLWAFPLILAALALIYGFLIAEPTYASTATLSVAPVQVQAQLEQRIQVQQATPITFEGLKALALSEETVGEVWEALRKEGKLPTRWQDRGSLRGIERMMRDLKVKDISPKLQAVNPNQVPPIVASLTVQAPDPQVAAKAANLWVEAVKRRVNAIPLARLEASLKALEEQVTPAEKAYREAQARWEAFNKTTTLPQDKAELDAKTQERVGLDTELAGLERDLAAVQGRIQATLAEMRRQEAIVPIGTPPEQLAIINRRLAEAQASLARELERVRQSYTQAAQVLEKFKGREQIPVWQAELSAYTEAYASAQARLIALQKDLAQKQALLQDAEARLAEYKAQLPNLSIENLVAGLTVKEAEALVADRLKEADSRLKAAEGAWAEFQRKSQLEVWKRQLGGYADRVASIRQRLESLATDRFRVEADLGEARRRFDQYKAQLPNLSIENLVAGLTVKEAEALVADRLKEADSRLKAAEGAWAEFQRKSQLEVWKRQLGGYADRVASIRQRLESLATERAIKQTRLEEAEKELAKEPRLITLEREITADPAVAAAIAQGGNLRDLLGLKLKNQELNPTHLKLLSTALDLRADLAALDREEKALKEEEAKLAPLVQDLQRRIADEEATRARLLTELDTARDIYNAVYRYAESLKKVASRPDAALREVNPDVLAYRDRIVDLEARLVALKAEEEALKEEERKLAPLVQDLQRRIADEEATRARLLTELDTARDIYNAVYRYAESLKKVASRPDVVLREVNPDVLAYRDRVVGLRAEIAGLKAEEGALKRSLTELDGRIRDRKAKIAAQEREKEAVTLEYATKKAAYEAFRSRYDQIASLTAQDLTFDNPNPEFQRLRSALIDAQAEEARLSARRAALLARINQVEARIGLLKDRVAKAQVEQDTVNQALDLAKNAYLALAQKRTDLQIQIASNQEAWASILAPAYPIYEKVAPKRGLLLALAVVLGLMLGVMAAFVAEALRPKEPAPQVG
ncbi:Wzz/FepE/Etk N-terminal domain-containing protein [Thermus sp.]|uniref:Wzz/FepE/Etk N-terminal domain-containing protein n=1 Tax=Thermus sp. TaxID=275 RepID=UPI0028CE0192|nr:Wzz/FepE/Etk N-terminal domain-containing protein [Thermus sp.]MDT7909767.1 Wzz/FepE/Etk N-terminal domain-containing protein [Thermus sp.]